MSQSADEGEIAEALANGDAAWLASALRHELQESASLRAELAKTKAVEQEIVAEVAQLRDDVKGLQDALQKAVDLTDTALAAVKAAL